MPSLDETFDVLKGHLSDPDLLSPARSDPFFYFIHDPGQTLEIKRKLHVWSAALRRDGWTVEQVSLSHLLWTVVEESGRWEEWLGLEPDADLEQMNEAVRDVLRGHAFVEGVAEHVSEARPKSIVLLTDAASLHPYFRVRALESTLHDRVRVSTVLFYPGYRSGQHGLRFLGFYPEDGNYRSTLVGGLP